MPCPLCLSSNQAEFPAEISIHFAGPENWTKPNVWVFPKILVCLVPVLRFSQSQWMN